jgi:hypothetical protein
MMSDITHFKLLREELQAILATPHARKAAQKRLYQITPAIVAGQTRKIKDAR